MAHIELVVVPYDSGHRGVRMGGGPGHLLDRGIARALTEDRHEVTVNEVESRVELAAEIAVAFDLAASIAAAVREARAAGRLPLVLAGNCFSAVGTMAGLEPSRTGVIWLDAHGDLNTPETTSSGFLDGMALATVTGRCWRHLAGAVPGFAPVSDHRLVLVGARDLDAPEEALAAALGIRRIGTDDLDRLGARAALAPHLGRIGQAVDSFYLHVDLDVLDPLAATANEYAAPGGLSLDQLRDVVALAGECGGIGAAGFTALDPEYDQGGRAADAAISVARWVAAHAGDRRTPPPVNGALAPPTRPAPGRDT